ncbi:MAG: potassium transporter TrkG [Spirochaetales bacterium]|nr:potassium transporter TrkG [Spirochaetales bacterium]
MKLVMHVLSLIVGIVVVFMLMTGGIALICGEPGVALVFLKTFLYTLPPILVVYFVTRSSRKKSVLGTKDGFMLVSLAWLFASAVGALPYVMSGAIPSYTEAFFETMSGFTTTGASILTAIEPLPRGILFWRSLTHWLGGMGIVVLTVALLPILGVGGLQLLKAEAPGPSVDKITPKITETAKILWAIYAGMTVLETALLMAGGMDWFDALTHTFGTLATGGFSTMNSSVGAYESPFVHNVITTFMVMAGLNFALYYRLLIGDIKNFWKDTEMKVYLSIFFLISLLMALNLQISGTYEGFNTSFRFSAFQAASIITTTGFATADFAQWPEFSQNLLFFLMFVGGCAGSTGGGMKVVRLTMLTKVGLNEMKRFIHPKGIFPLRINGEVVKKDIVYSIAGFVMLYLFILLLVTLAVSFGGHDIITSFTTALATLGNIGPGFGKVGPAMNYHFYSVPIKWILSFAMMLGRLEIYTVLVILTPHFWKK